MKLALFLMRFMQMPFLPLFVFLKVVTGKRGSSAPHAQRACLTGALTWGGAPGGSCLGAPRWASASAGHRGHPLSVCPVPPSAPLPLRCGAGAGGRVAASANQASQVLGLQEQLQVMASCRPGCSQAGATRGTQDRAGSGLPLGAAPVPAQSEALS